MFLVRFSKYDRFCVGYFCFVEEVKVYFKKESEQNIEKQDKSEGHKILKETLKKKEKVVEKILILKRKIW